MPYFIDTLRRTRDTRRPRAYYCDEQELLDIANQIRKAGGADALDAFFPSYAGHAKTCLIATSLNFGCAITGWPTIKYFNTHVYDPKDEVWPSGCSRWCMVVDTARQAKALAEAMGWEVVDENGFRNCIILPEKVGNTAAAFDEGKGWTRKYALPETD